MLSDKIQTCKKCVNRDLESDRDEKKPMKKYDKGGRMLGLNQIKHIPFYIACFAGVKKKCDNLPSTLSGLTDADKIFKASSTYLL